MKQAGKYDLLLEYIEAIELLVLLRQDDTEETEQIPKRENDDSEIRFCKESNLAKFGMIIIILLLIYVMGEFFITQHKIERMLKSTTLVPSETNHKMNDHETITF